MNNALIAVLKISIIWAVVSDWPSRSLADRHRIRAAYMDPSAGLNRHYRYCPKYGNFYWAVLLFAYLFILGGFIYHFFFLAEGDTGRVSGLWAIGVLFFTISLPGIPSIIVLLDLAFNKKSGLYICEDKITFVLSFHTTHIYKKDIKEVRFIGLLRGFEVILHNGKKKCIAPVLVENLPQQICTLLLYVSNSRKNIDMRYNRDFFAYLQLICENRRLRKAGLPVQSLKGLRWKKKN